jgi:hypothetical protein
MYQIFSFFHFMAEQGGQITLTTPFVLTDTKMWKLGTRKRAVFLGIHESDLVCSVTEKRSLQNIKTSKQLTEGFFV